MSKPGRQHWEAIKWIFRYLGGIVGHDIAFGNQIMQVIWIIEGRQLGLFLLLVEDLYVGSQLSSLLLHYLPLKLNT